MLNLIFKVTFAVLILFSCTTYDEDIEPLPNREYLSVYSADLGNEGSMSIDLQKKEVLLHDVIVKIFPCSTRKFHCIRGGFNFSLPRKTQDFDNIKSWELGGIKFSLKKSDFYNICGYYGDDIYRLEVKEDNDEGIWLYFYSISKGLIVNNYINHESESYGTWFTCDENFLTMDQLIQFSNRYLD